MTGYDAAEQYIEKIANLGVYTGIAKSIWNNIKPGSNFLSTFKRLHTGITNTGTGMFAAGKEALKGTALRGLNPAEIGKFKNVAYGAGILGAGTVGLGVGNSIANKTRANTPPPPTDVQVVYANPYNQLR